MIEHVFVLMLENRSFDHLFGLSQPQATPIPPAASFASGATDRCPIDPPHEFDDVQHQVNGGAMDGFDADAQRRGFVAAQLPALNELAARYVLFDNWHSSLPGPTWPNRFFVHAASSGGLCTSPTSFRSAGAVILPDESFQFDNGTLFDLLERKFPQQPAWRVYHGDVSPQVLALPGMVDKYYQGNDWFRPIYPTTALDGTLNDDGFAADVNSSAGYAPKYTFIEPNYAIQLLGATTFTTGDSMHPCGLASAGDQLVRHVYESLSASPIWGASVLLVLWDEHGGFYDHVPPRSATPPGDAEHNRAKGDDGAGFAFDRYGVRVPALLIGPNAPARGLGSTLFPGQVFDHASVVSTVRALFQLGGPLTNRDRDALAWHGCLTAPARTTGLQLASVPPTADPASATPPATAPGVDGFTNGMGLIAMHLDKVGASLSSQAPVGDFSPKSAAEFHQAREASLQSGDFPRVLGTYLGAVQARAAAVKAVSGSTAAPTRTA
jgi:phospholipase C